MQREKTAPCTHSLQNCLCYIHSNTVDIDDYRDLIMFMTV